MPLGTDSRAPRILEQRAAGGIEKTLREIIFLAEDYEVG